MRAVIGVADHSGWAVCVTVALDRTVPAVVERRRIDLIEPGLPSQPYHHETVNMARPEAEQLAARVRASVLATTLARVSELVEELRPTCAIRSIAIRVPPLPRVPVTVAEAHASYNVMCRADGMMYHDALCTAARGLELGVEQIPRGAEIATAASRVGMSEAEVERFVRSAGVRLGPPWQKEHRLAVAAAVAVLAASFPVSLRA